MGDHVLYYISSYIIYCILSLFSIYLFFLITSHTFTSFEHLLFSYFSPTIDSLEGDSLFADYKHGDISLT